MPFLFSSPYKAENAILFWCSYFSCYAKILFFF